MIKPTIGEPNLGAYVGTIVGAAGGLLALGIAPAVLTHKAAQLVALPILSIISWLVCAAIGWLLGGQIGPRLEWLLGERNGGITGGIIGGLLPVTAIALWSWHMITMPGVKAATTPWRYGGVEFAAPSGWTVENVAGGLLILCPEVEAGWQANLFLRIEEDKQMRPAEKAVDSLAPGLQTNKLGFRELRRSAGEQKHGLQAALIEYTCMQDQTPLTEWMVIFELGGSKRLSVSASSATVLWDKYQPKFEAVLNSLQLSRK